ncbi:hypothetical protein BSLG_009355 [Batrachochytrium salamandrivorans]|nr:hypothetical protein BSLG_009355 [Batrachochytrium salamandrivorans]
MRSVRVHSMGACSAFSTSTKSLGQTGAAATNYLTVTQDLGENGVPTGVVIVGLNRPETLNPMSEPMGIEFTRVLKELGTSPAVRAVVLTGNGRAFSAGGDLEFREIAQEPPHLRTSLPVPTIACINGHAVGAGFCLALACDMRIANTHAKMGLNFVRIGLTPGMGGSYILPVLAGQQVAARMMLTGDLVTGAEAESLGLVLKHTEPEEAMNESMKIARRIALASPVAVRQTVKTLRMQLHDGALERALQREADTQAICYSSVDMVEGLDAIAQKRNPVFSSPPI